MLSRSTASSIFHHFYISWKLKVLLNALKKQPKKQNSETLIPGLSVLIIGYTVGSSLYVDVIGQIWFQAIFDLTSVDFQFLLSSTRGRQKKNENQPRIKKLNLKLYLAGNIDICETNKEKKTSFLQRLVKNY